MILSNSNVQSSVLSFFSPYVKPALLSIHALIVLSILSFTIGTMPGLSEEAKSALRTFEVIAVLIFTAEYLIRFILADRKLAYFFSFYGLVDLLAILPFYIASGLDLRALRILRLLRLLRIFKLIRYSKAVSRVFRALAIAKEELVLFFISTSMILYLSAVGIYYFESGSQPELFGSVPRCLWWAVTTLTTVGYGDMYPVTTGGKFFTFLVLMLGLGVIAAPAGLIASAFSQAREEENI